MLTAQVLTENSWILQDQTNMKIGIISYNLDKEKYLLVTKDMDIELESFSELEETLGPIKIQERTTQQHIFKDIDGYTICHESAEDIKKLDNGLIKYTPSGKSKKEYYAGYWVTLMPEGNWIRRASLSVNMHEELSKKDCSVFGPYKEKIEANFMIKKLNSK